MKKKLEAELISIAHRILKLSDRSTLPKLQEEAKNLYEKLTILSFAESHFAGPQPTIGQIQSVFEEEETREVVSQENILQTALLVEKGNASTADTSSIDIAETSIKIAEEELEKEVEELQSEVIDITNQEVNLEPELLIAQDDTLSVDTIAEVAETSIEIPEEELEEEVKEVPSEIIDVVEQEIVFESESLTAQDRTSNDDTIAEVVETSIEISEDEIKEPEEAITGMPEIIIERINEKVTGDLFVPLTEVNEQNNVASELGLEKKEQDEIATMDLINDDKPKSLNDQLKKGINIGLNDRLAFIKYLFDGSSTDYNRVLSQLNTLDSKDESIQFITNIVKPDYNNWDGKEEYEERFIEIVLNKYQS